MSAPVVIWSDAAELDLLAFSPSVAERVVDEVDAFALSGRGFVRVMLDGSAERRLYLPAHYVIFEFERDTLRLYRVVPR